MSILEQLFYFVNIQILRLPRRKLTANAGILQTKLCPLFLGAAEDHTQTDEDDDNWPE